jgi:hypothetical protein
MTSVIKFFEVIAVMGSWWFVFAAIYQAVSSKVEAYFKLEHDSVIIDDIYTAIAFVGLFSFLLLAPMIVA